MMMTRMVVAAVAAVAVVVGTTTGIVGAAVGAVMVMMTAIHTEELEDQLPPLEEANPLEKNAGVVYNSEDAEDSEDSNPVEPCPQNQFHYPKAHHPLHAELNDLHLHLHYLDRLPPLRISPLRV
jgi:hypothetical protein